MRYKILASAGLALLCTAGSALAAGPQFSADTVQSRPGLELQSGKIYVSDLGTRFEFQQRGRPVVQIMLAGKGIMRVLYPLDRVYMEFKGRPGAPAPNARPDAPCTPLPQLDCKREADEKIGGLKAERWSVTPKGSPAQVRVWWDSKRKMALREEYFDGRVMQAIMRGTEQYENRQVESWEFTYLSPNGRYRRAMSLIAPDLGVAVVERLPGGAMRQLRNIAVGAPDPKLFDVPAGYKLVEPPKPAVAGPQIRGRQQPPGAGPRGPRGSFGGPYMGPAGQMGQMTPPAGRAAPGSSGGGGTAK